MDENQAKQILEQQVLTVAKAVEDKLDDQIAVLDRLDLDDLEALRERGLQQLKKMAERRSKWISLGHGDYSEIAEKDFFAAVKASDRVVCHFYRENWPCKMSLFSSSIIALYKFKEIRHSGDGQALILAKQHVETRFLKIHAENPFLTEKLRIIVLPTLALVKNAKVEDHVVGFDELGGTDEFSTEELDERLAKAQVIFFEGDGQALILAKQHVETRFLKIHAENPFLTEKLRIIVLPTLALVKNAKVEDHVVGFDELGGTDEFSTEELDERLAKAQVIFFEGEASLHPIKPSTTKRSVRQLVTSNLSDSD
ncbi:putative Thioredoxin domain-containing protein 9 [Cocos nucifera]|uniref:Putative Thioredoxin domain-containing protein 9 n=1 Tax=Cocos nucifera TaxID=13894 RepID=A0A8K0MUS9_COCNU|nr:putative Thioredoxin domain-containing protein 9 [Cocos nucifera]